MSIDTWAWGESLQGYAEIELGIASSHATIVQKMAIDVSLCPSRIMKEVDLDVAPFSAANKSKQNQP